MLGILCLLSLSFLAAAAALLMLLRLSAPRSSICLEIVEERRVNAASVLR
eukprot:COSAG01_NODE_5945_length_3940_cov_3.383494_2_plen_50_part_00